MKYRQILFNTPMVQAILEGRKTQTRRLPWLQPGPEIELRIKKTEDGKIVAHFYRENPLYDEANKSPYGAYQEPMCQPGDVLWVRETWNGVKIGNPKIGYQTVYFYKTKIENPDDRWRPSIHMPKEAARIFLKVTDIRVERLQEITDAGALKEGVPSDDDFPMDEVYCPTCHGQGIHRALHPVPLGYMDVECENCDTPVKRFSHLWDSTIKKQHVIYYGWEANPWVWVYEFERIEKPEGWPNV